MVDHLYLINGTLTGTTNPSQSVSEDVFHISQCSKTGDAV